MRRRWVMVVLGPVVSVLLFVGAMEMILAAAFPIPHSIERNMFFDPDPFTGYRIRPNSRGMFGETIPAVANANGHRDDYVPVEKSPGVFRVLVLGDSFTVGANVRREEAYPQILETLLAARMSRPVEIVNAGVGGWDPFHYAQYYERFGRKFDPDLVLIGFFVGNDTYSHVRRFDQTKTAVLGRRVRRDSARKPWIVPLVFLSEHSHLARLLLRRPPRPRRIERDGPCDGFSKNYLEIQRARLSNHLRRAGALEKLAETPIRQINRIADRARGEGRSVVVALLPDENQLNPALQDLLVPEGERSRYDFTMPQALLKERFAELGVPVIDLLPAFAADERCLYMNDTHWVPEGHRLAAEAVAAALGELIPDLLVPSPLPGEG